MSHPQQSVLIISNDTTVVEAIVSNNTTDHAFNARPSIQEALGEPGLLENNGIVIFDIGTTENNVEKAIDHAIKLKQADPTQVLMMVGDKEPLNDILKSNIQPMIYRAFNKPISPNQLFLSFKSASALNQELIAKRAAGEDILVIGPQENRTNLDTIAEDRKTSPLVYAGAGAVVLALVAYLFLGGDEEQKANNEILQTVEIEETVSTELTNVNSQLNDLNQKASTALLDGRYISPKGNNALEYYDQALTVDPYDSVAYEGRKSVAAALRTSYEDLIEKQKFDDAFNALDKITSIEPLNPDNDKLQKSLEDAVKAAAEKERLANVASNTPAKSSTSAAVLKKLDASKTTASSALQKEQVLINQIKSSIAKNNLIPPQSNNAYTLISDALRGNKVSRSNSAPLLKSLSSKLLAQANNSFNKNDLTATTKLMSYINRIDVGNPGLAELRSKVNTRKIAIAQSKDDKEVASALAARKQAEQKQAAEARIVPAKIISRSSLRYPSAAEKQNIEGWVQVTFVVDTNGSPKDVVISGAQPTGYFEEAALKSIKKWHFSPARNQETGEAVESKPISTKLQFRLD